MLVFMEELENAHINMFDTAATNNGVRCKPIKDEMTLEFTIIEAAQCDTGIYLMPTEFGRGVDFKLQKDAFVIVLMNGSLSLKDSDINQMAGRGNRSQGTPQGHVILCKDSVASTNVKTLL